jgi:catechol 2,3-dioxygenase-like lactoylglutathione lyase family enzyme
MALGPLAQVHVSVRDIEVSVAFYRDVLGVPLLFQVPGQPMAFFDLGSGVRLYLGVPESAEFRTKTLLYYRVADIDAERKRLVDLGVEFSDEPHVVHRDAVHELWMTATKDPDGHHVILSEERVTQPA